jgi:hypothetical protein
MGRLATHAILAVHIAAGLTAVGSGLLATTARKRPGRHPRAGTVYLYAVGVVFLTATALTAARWRAEWHLFLIATVAFGLAATGWWARRRRPRRWLAGHGAAMAGSFIALFTGFYVDNGPRLPLWDRLPHVAYWLIPAAVGLPLTWRALVRNGAFSRADGALSRGPGTRYPPSPAGSAAPVPSRRRW